MKKTAYKTPVMEVVKLAYSANILAGSFNENTELPISGEGGSEEPER